MPTGFSELVIGPLGYATLMEWVKVNAVDNLCYRCSGEGCEYIKLSK